MPCELIFLIDNSGSMSGQSIQHVIFTLQIFLRSLPSNCRFNMISFNSTFTSLFQESVALNDSTLAKASRFVADLQAQGGTVILPALSFVYKTPPTEGYPRQIFLLTDGAVENTEKVIEMVHENCDTCRVFTFGIGYRYYCVLFIVFHLFIFFHFIFFILFYSFYFIHLFYSLTFLILL